MTYTCGKTILSRREKNKGNEAYRASENRDVYDSYAVPVYDASSAVVFANRAMACLRLGLLERVRDGRLKIDPSYHKARQRRGMTVIKRKMLWLLKILRSLCRRSR